jgi:regulator of sigma E protease
MNLLAVDWSGIGQWVGGILLAILILLAMVSIHEFGHYVAGKALGFKITEFSIGFGPALFKKRSKKSGEVFAVRAIPLGGYCAFDGEDYDEEDARAELQRESKEKAVDEPFTDFVSSVADQKEATVSALNEESVQTVEAEKPAEEEYPEPKGERFNNQAPWKRIIVLVAGAVMNYLLALVLLLIMCFSYGVPMCIVIPADYNGEQLTPVEWETEALSAADILVSIDGRSIGMYTDCMDALKGKLAGDSVPVEVYRLTKEGWKPKTVTLTLIADVAIENSADMEGLVAAMGFQVGTQSVRTTFWRTVGGAFAYSGEMATSVLRTVGELITGAFGDKTADVVGGPVSTIGQTAQIAISSPFSFLYMASFIGVNLAVFNLLPVPALDGCKVIFCIIEWIRKKPINRKVEAIINFAGIVFLFGFAILIDVLKLF